MKALLPLLIATASVSVAIPRDAWAQANASPAGPAAKFEELARRPQMGWNTWNNFACNINEKLV